VYLTIQVQKATKEHRIQHCMLSETWLSVCAIQTCVSQVIMKCFWTS